MGKIQIFRGVFRQEVSRLLCSWKLYASIAAYLLICFLTALSDTGELENAEQGLMIIESLSNLNKLLVLVAAFPFAASFCEDYVKRYMNQVILRSSQTAYVMNKLFVCFLTSFFISFVGLGLYSMFNAMNMGLGLGEFKICPGDSFYDLASGNMPYLYIVVKCVPFAAVSAVYAVMGLMLSAVIPNKFVAVTAPFFMNTVMEIIYEKIPREMSLFRIQESRIPYVSSTGEIMGITVAVCLGYILISGVIFSSFAKRRINNELT